MKIKLQKGKTVEVTLQRNHYAIRGWEYRVNGVKLGMVYKRAALGNLKGRKEGAIIYTMQSDINVMDANLVQILQLGIRNVMGAYIAEFESKKEAQKALRKYLQLQLEAISEITDIPDRPAGRENY